MKKFLQYTFNRWNKINNSSNLSKKTDVQLLYIVLNNIFYGGKI